METGPGQPSAGSAPEPAQEADERPSAPSGGDGPSTDPEPLRPLPIASYDDLTAREIIGLLDDLDHDQLERIRAHEQANRARKTVLAKLDRLGA